ncbi:PE/PPE C-terminal domain-containing protein [Mycobacterium sp.]|uniref:PE/PPE C-terminal domain-containing protein n=1 Tax=Mycobacterium sp. TaxID=1785 RepID=UPI002BB74C72|nr:PE/PPE C-terminal domain-containing protein [Mycobacterium sp.]HTQ19316.1 PE/PPE C-terminal domain-containing protein [Mycobacterium sp.]
MGKAVPIGQLSVPHPWATAAVPPSPTPLTGAAVSQAVRASDPGNMLGGMPFAGMTPRSEATAGAVPRAGFRPTVVPREGIGG